MEVLSCHFDRGVPPLLPWCDPVIVDSSPRQHQYNRDTASDREHRREQFDHRPVFHCAYHAPSHTPRHATPRHAVHTMRHANANANAAPEEDSNSHILLSSRPLVALDGRGCVEYMLPTQDEHKYTIDLVEYTVLCTDKKYEPMHVKRHPRDVAARTFVRSL